MGSVEKRTRTNKDGKKVTFWLARWHDPKSGRQPSKSFPKKELARDFLKEVEADLLRGEYVSKDAGKISFKEYAEEWLEAQTFDRSTYDAVELRFRLHVFPILGTKPIGGIKPSGIQAWLKTLEGLAPSYRRVIYANVSTVFTAAIADEVIRKNPCASPTIARPRVVKREIEPWEMSRVRAVRAGLPDRYRIVATLAFGLGLRQGEVFGLSFDDFDIKRRRVTIRRQVKLFNGSRLVFALPKFEKIRNVPLPGTVLDAVQEYQKMFPPASVTLPWKKVDGDPVAASLIVVSREKKALNKNYFNQEIWKKALGVAGVPASRENGCHMLRHVYASGLLYSGESPKAVSEYLGHADAAFTLRTYAHLMPGSDDRTRSAIDAMFGVTGV